MRWARLHTLGLKDVCACLLLSCVWLFATPGGPPGSSVHGILQARILEWVAIASSIICISLIDSDSMSWPRGLHNSMKLWAMLCRAVLWPLGRVIVESSDKMWSTGGRNGKPLQYSCLENPTNSRKRQKDMTPEKGAPKLEGVQYANGKELHFFWS